MYNMDFNKRHPHHSSQPHVGHVGGFIPKYNHRSSPTVAGAHNNGFNVGSNSFVNQHHHVQNNSARGCRSPDSRLNLSHSFKNLMKVYNDVHTERGHTLQNLTQGRDFIQNRVVNIVRELLSDEFLDSVVHNVKAHLVNMDDFSGESGGNMPEGNVSQVQEIIQMKSTEATRSLLVMLKSQREELENQILEETQVHKAREQGYLEAEFQRERRVEKEFMEFFNDADRQIIEFEKKIRSESYNQLLTRVRTCERELAFRDQKIGQLEENLKMINDRCEKLMAELQQVNADHQFEKLQLYHHVEVCKANAKCMAMDELLRWCRWKRCPCGREYDNELLRDLEVNLNIVYTNICHDHDALMRHPCRDAREKLDFGCSNNGWNFPTYQAMVAAPAPLFPIGNFVPSSEEAATKGNVTNDLRDRHDELQLKAAVMPNYEEIRTMIMKIVCHFKVGGLRVCEELTAKQYVSTLFYCDSEDLVPAKTDKIFSSGYGDTPEEATEKSAKRAFEEIQRMENWNSNSGSVGMQVTFVRKNPVESKFGLFDSEPVRMTLIRSYCNETPLKDGQSGEKANKTKFIQEGNLYQNHSTAKEKYLADWKIHMRVEDVSLVGVYKKLKNILCKVENIHVENFLGILENGESKVK